MKALCTPAVTPSVNSAITLGWAGSSREAITMPFFRSEAPSRVKTRNLPSGVVITSLTRRVLVMIESVTTGLAGIADVDGEEHVAAAPAAEVGVLAVGMNPDLFGGEAGARQPADHGGGPADVARHQRDGRVGAAVADTRR